MAQDQPIKALVITFLDDAASAVYSINRLKPEALCFVLPEGSKALVETEIQPNIQQMPRKWDWIVLADTAEFPSVYQSLARSLPDLVRRRAAEAGLADAAPAAVLLTSCSPAATGGLRAIVEAWRCRVYAPDGRALQIEGVLGADRLDARVETDPNFLARGRYVVEIQTTEQSHFPIRRYAVEVR